jgi:hypothetical protein
MSLWFSLFDSRLAIHCDPAAGPPPADAVLLVPSLFDVAIVTDLKGDRGWLYREPQGLLRAVHVLQWLKKRGPVYFRPQGSKTYFKANLGPC